VLGSVPSSQVNIHKCWVFCVLTTLIVNVIWFKARMPYKIYFFVHARLCKLQKSALDSQLQVIEFTSCLPMVSGSLQVLRLPPPLKLVRFLFNIFPHFGVIMLISLSKTWSSIIILPFFSLTFLVFPMIQLTKYQAYPIHLVG
jgi:hypothetical protein